MTRKEYTNRMQNLIVAIHKHPTTNTADINLGKALRYAKDHAREAAENFGSYEAAWNCSGLRWAREYYGVG